MQHRLADTEVKVAELEHELASLHQTHNVTLTHLGAATERMEAMEAELGGAVVTVQQQVDRPIEFKNAVETLMNLNKFLLERLSEIPIDLYCSPRRGRRSWGWRSPSCGRASAATASRSTATPPTR